MDEKYARSRVSIDYEAILRTFSFGAMYIYLCLQKKQQKVRNGKWAPSRKFSQQQKFYGKVDEKKKKNFERKNDETVNIFNIRKWKKYEKYQAVIAL